MRTSFRICFVLVLSGMEVKGFKMNTEKTKRYFPMTLPVMGNCKISD